MSSLRFWEPHKMRKPRQSTHSPTQPGERALKQTRTMRDMYVDIDFQSHCSISESTKFRTNSCKIGIDFQNNPPEYEQFIAMIKLLCLRPASCESSMIMLQCMQFVSQHRRVCLIFAFSFQDWAFFDCDTSETLQGPLPARSNIKWKQEQDMHVLNSCKKAKSHNSWWRSDTETWKKERRHSGARDSKT